MKEKRSYSIFVGIDVGSKELVTCIHDAQKLMDDKPPDIGQFEQSKQSYLMLTRQIRKYAKQHGHSDDHVLITMEATNTYWQRPASYTNHV